METDRIAALEQENEQLRALVAATQTALVIEPGKTYVIEIDGFISQEQAKAIHRMWKSAVPDAKMMVLSGGARIARATVDA